MLTNVSRRVPLALITLAVLIAYAKPTAAQEYWITCGNAFPLQVPYVHDVPTYLGVEPYTIPFNPGYARKKRGATSHMGWYFVTPYVTTHNGKLWEWEDPGVHFYCRHFTFVGFGYDLRYPGPDLTTGQTIEGTAILIPDAMGPDDDNDENWGPGNGYAGLGGETSTVECYQVFRIVYGEQTGHIYERVPQGFSYCFYNNDWYMT